MSFKMFLFAALACLAAVDGAKLTNVHETDIASVDKESRILEVPTLGDVIFTGLKVTWYLISTVWSIVGYKLATVALIANVAIWVARNCFSAILGAAVTLAFCKLTGKCTTTLEYVQDYMVEVPEELSYAAKHLENGKAKFSS